MIRAYSVGTNPSPQEASVLVGLGMVAIASLALWYRDDLYWAYQWIIRYPQNGAMYMVAQVAVPVTIIVVGIALIAYPWTGW